MSFRILRHSSLRRQCSWRVLSCALFVLSGSAAARTQDRVPLPDLGALPEFSLIDEAQRPLTRQGMIGKVWVADFIFTRCAGQCPLMSGRMAALQQAFADAPDISLLSFTVDPAYDTPEHLAAYGAHYGARPDRWRFLTGPPETVAGLIRQGFHLAVGPEGSASEPITHSVRFVLVDRRAHVRGYYEATDPAALARLTDDARHLLAEVRP